MKKIILISICFFVLLQSVIKTVFVSNYLINKEYIAENLCENKDIKQLKCEGKCHLKKQLIKEQKKEQSSPNKVQEKIEFQIFQTYNYPDFRAFYKYIKPFFSVYINLYLKTLVFSVFHPPD